MASPPLQTDRVRPAAPSPSAAAHHARGGSATEASSAAAVDLVGWTTAAMAVVLCALYSLPATGLSAGTLAMYWTLGAGSVGIVLLRGRFHRPRAVALVSIWFLAGAVAVVVQGFTGGQLILLVATYLGGLFLGQRAAVGLMVASTLTYVGAGALHISGLAPAAPMGATALDAPLAWGVAIATFFAVGGMTVVALLLVLARLKSMADVSRRLSTVSTLMRDAVLLTDLEGRITWVSESFTTLTGFGLDEVAGKKPGAVLQGPESDQEASRKMGRHLARQEDFDATVLNYTKSGKQYWTDIEARVLRDERGMPEGFTSIQRVCTERLLIEHRVVLQRDLSRLFQTAHRVDDALEEAVALLAGVPGVRSVRLWRVSPDGTTLRCVRAVAPGADPELSTICRSTSDTFVACLSSCPKDAAADLAHAAWRTGAPAQSDALGSPDGGDSQAALRAAGIGSGTALPMLGPGGVLGVVEVLGSRFFPGYDSVERRLGPVVEKLSLFIQRCEERARFEWMFQQAPDALVRVDAQGRIEGMNLRAVALFGADAMAGGNAEALLGGGFLRATAAAREGATFMVHLDADAERDLEASAVRITEGGSQSWLVAVRDTTERRRIVQLELMQQTLGGLLTELPVATLLIDAAGVVRFANGAACALMRRTNTNLLATQSADLFSNLPGRAGASGAWTSPVLPTDATGDDGCEAIWPDGTRVPVAVSVASIALPASLPLGMESRVSQGASTDTTLVEHRILTLIDLTEHQKARAAILHARDAAEAATRAKGQFLANMSHELRTPLNALLGLSHLMLHGGPPAELRAPLRKLHNASRSLLGIVSDILDISKIEAGRLDVEAAPFDLHEVLGSVLELFTLDAAEKGLDLVADVDAAVPVRVSGDALRVSQVLRNFISNAVKFTARGEVVLRARVAHGDPSGPALVFDVLDTGIGMDEATLSTLFEPFTQADTSTTRVFGGTGLGLAISRQLANLMDGEVTLESTKGVGTTARLRIRLCQIPGIAPEGATVDQAFPEVRGARLLVVEPRRTSRDAVASMARSMGLVVRAAESLAEADALQATDDGLFDLVLVDATLGRPPSAAGSPVVVKMVRGGVHGGGSWTPDVVALPVLPSTLLETFARALGRLGPASQIESIPEAPLLRGRVLLVEDNDINREIGVQLLQQFGLDVVEASHGQEALEVYRAVLDDPDGAPIDLVLMDVQMPGMDGLTAAAALRSIDHPAAASVPILAMTAHGTREDRERSLAAGMNDHLTKPVDPSDLARAVRRWLSKSTGRLLSRAPESPRGTDDDDAGWA